MKDVLKNQINIQLPKIATRLIHDGSYAGLSALLDAPFNSKEVIDANMSHEKGPDFHKNIIAVIFDPTIKHSLIAQMGYLIMKLIKYIDFSKEITDEKLMKLIPKLEPIERIYNQYIRRQKTTKNEDIIEISPIVWPFVMFIENELSASERFLVFNIAANFHLRNRIREDMRSANQYTKDDKSSFSVFTAWMEASKTTFNSSGQALYTIIKDKYHYYARDYLDHIKRIDQIIQELCLLKDGSNVVSLEVFTRFDDYYWLRDPITDNLFHKFDVKNRLVNKMTDDIQLYYEMPATRKMLKTKAESVLKSVDLDRLWVRLGHPTSKAFFLPIEDKSKELMAKYEANKEWNLLYYYETNGKVIFNDLLFPVSYTESQK